MARFSWGGVALLGVIGASGCASPTEVVGAEEPAQYEEGNRPVLDPTRAVPEPFREVAYTLNYESVPSYDDSSSLQTLGPMSVAIVLQGTSPSSFRGWCVDTQYAIDDLTLYHGELYSMYEALPESAHIVQPENLDAANYLLNAHPVGSTLTVPEMESVLEITDDDLQAALRTLLSSPPEVERPALVATLVSESLENGEGFVPGPGGHGLLLVVGTGTPVQTLAIDVVVPESPPTEGSTAPIG